MGSLLYSPEIENEVQQESLVHLEEMIKSDGTISDEELMKRYCDGDTVAFEQLYQRHRGGLYRYFLRQCKAPEIAEELYQDVWLKIVNARTQYEVNAKFSTYLYRVAHNRLIDYFRHLSSSQHKLRVDDSEYAIEQAQASESEVDFIDAENLNQKLKQAVTMLPHEQREVFLMQQEGHLTLADIAEITETSRETVKSRLRYAMNKLREQLGGLR